MRTFQRRRWECFRKKPGDSASAAKSTVIATTQRLRRHSWTSFQAMSRMLFMRPHPHDAGSAHRDRQGRWSIATSSAGPAAIGRATDEFNLGARSHIEFDERLPLISASSGPGRRLRKFFRFSRRDSDANFDRQSRELAQLVIERFAIVCDYNNDAASAFFEIRYGASESTTVAPCCCNSCTIS